MDASMRDAASTTLLPGARDSVWLRAAHWARAQRNFLLIVILPTLIVTAYFGLVASNQYESEADFIVRQTADSPAPIAGLNQALSLVGGGATESQTEALSVSDYLLSHDAVSALRARSQLVDRFSRSDVDPLSRLWSADPKPESLLKYYRRQVDVEYNTETGITALRVRAFSPQDAYAISNAMLQLGEERVNALNVRLYQDTLAVANRELGEAEEAVARSQSTLTSFRQSNDDIDPTGTSTAQIRLVSDLNGQLAAARAQLSAMTGSIRPDSPQYVALTARVHALEGQVASQSSLLAGSGAGKTIATDLGAYEELRLRQDFAAKRYAAAAAALEQARDRASKQQLFVVRVVEPNLPVKSTYPKRLTIVATVFFALLLAYGIGWLIAAGVREHAS
jgi:capsular polysaccharide transport system permease protein